MRLGKAAIVSIATPITAVAAWPEYPWVTIGIAAAAGVSLVVLLVVFASRGGTVTLSAGRGDGRKAASVRVPGRRPPRKG
ncbi:hypothetical protein Pth03_76150 [Planotetraspora thailandica]|uniref:Uncharacterized protein n=1 Tax=Planotetraspora thailandica TaxID=487172 RepID=A0A8J3Y1V3_9ACTN|nr:hypothetical protein Pth03_76150 [Planotetraspora thailandica]